MPPRPPSIRFPVTEMMFVPLPAVPIVPAGAPPTSAAFPPWMTKPAPDGKLLAAGDLSSSGAADGMVRLWDTESGKELRQFRGHKHSIHSLAFSPDGKTLATGSDTIRLWDVVTGKRFPQFKEGNAPIWSLGFAPDSKTLVTGMSHPHSVRPWSGGWMLPDSRRGSVVLMDRDFWITKVVDADFNWVQDCIQLPKGNLDVTGRYFLWTSNMGGDRLDAFLVKVPAELLTGAR